MPRSKALLMLALGFAAGALTAQEAAEAVRRPTFVRVVDARGEPLANATVWLAGGQPHLGAVVGAIDSLVVASDARGRAQAKLQPGLCYVAWAVGPVDDAGRGFASAPTGYFGAGSLFELRCAQPYEARRITIAGAEAWTGPLRYFVLTPYPGAEEELLPDDAGRITVPPWPQATIEVRTGDGRPLWSVPASTLAAEQLRIPPPREIAVRVVDEKGAPLAGAAIRLRVTRQRPWNVDGLGGVVDGRFRELAVTPASGRATVQVPYPVDPFVDQSRGELLLFANVRGRPAVAGGVFAGSLYQDERKVNAVTDGELLFTCKSVDPLAGTCRSVPAGTTVHLAAVCKLFIDRSSYSHDARSFVATVGEDGAFVFDDVPAELHSCRVTMLLPEGRGGTASLFPAMAGRELPPPIAAPAAGRTVPPTTTNVTAVRLRVTDPGGGPARGVVTFLVPADLFGVLLRDSLVRVPLDAAGSAVVSIVQGTWIVMVHSSAGFAATKIEVASAEMEVPLAMQALATMKVRLLDAGGEPIAGARVVTKSSSTRSSGDPVEAMLQSIGQQMRSSWGTLATDVRGTVTIPFMQVKGVTNRIVLTWDGGSTEQFVLEANDAPLELRAK